MATGSISVRQQFGDEVVVGSKLPDLVWMPIPEQLFRFSAVTWNAHRIHYDAEYARTEGHPHILVQAHLHGAVLTRMVMDWIGPLGRLKGIRWQNRGRAIPSDILTCQGSVQGRTPGDGVVIIELEISEHNQRNEVCVAGSATVTLPLRRLTQDA